MNLDSKDVLLISEIKRGIPITTPRPFDALAKKLWLGLPELFDRLSALKQAGWYERISANFDLHRMGYKTALLGMQLQAGGLERAVEILSNHPCINYLCRRDHTYSLWATLSLPSLESLRMHASTLKELTEADQLLLMPARKRFRIASPPPEPVAVGARPVWDAQDLKLIRVLQKDLPLIERPFSWMAQEAELSEDQFIQKVYSWITSDKMKPLMCARQPSVRPNLKSITVAWRVPEESIGKFGQEVMRFKEVKQCADRVLLDEFPYNLFALIQTPTVRACHEVICDMELKIGQWPFVTLLTLAEYKRAPVRFFPEELEVWEEKHAVVCG